MVTYRSKWKNGRAWLYGSTIGLMIFIGLFEHYAWQNPPKLIFFKVLAAPIFMLASYGIEFLCNSDRAYKRGTAQYFERHAIHAWFLASLITIVNYHLHSTLTWLISWLVIMFVIFFGLNIFLRPNDKRRPNA